MNKIHIMNIKAVKPVPSDTNHNQSETATEREH